MSTLPLTQLTSDVYFSLPTETTDRPVLGAVIGQQSILMVDAGNSPAHASSFLEALRQLGFSAPTYIALTHYHWDHVFGAAYLEGLLCSSVETGERLREMVRMDWRDKALDQRVEDGIEHEFLRKCIKAEMSNVERAKLKLRTPDITFTQSMDINLGEITCQLINIGGDHTSDSSIIYVPQRKVVFLGDCLCSKFTNSGFSYTTQKLFPLLDTLLSLDADYYIYSHSSQPITRDEMEKEARILKAIGKAVTETHANRLEAQRLAEKELGFPFEEGRDQDLDAFINGFKTT